jgi:hypothetical protein
MVIRLVKHLIRVTIGHNSFYVTLGTSRLLHDYWTSQAARLYAVLIQNSRHKDERMMRVTKNKLMDAMQQRFPDRLQTYTTDQQEERFVAQPRTPRLIQLVKDCLERFTPWGTACVIPIPFSRDIPTLASSGNDPEEDHPAEANRIHTMIHPDCFSTLVRSLRLDAPAERLTVPKLAFASSGEPRGDRTNPPKLAPEDYQQVLQWRKEQERRQKAFLARRLRLYVNGRQRAAFDPRRTWRLHLKIAWDEDLLEVRGEDAEGELVLTTLLIPWSALAPGDSLRDWTVLHAGQKITIEVTPRWDEDGTVQEADVEVRHAETQPLRVMAWLVGRAWVGVLDAVGKLSGVQVPRWSWAAAGGSVIVIVLTTLILWSRLQPLPELPPPPEIQARRLPGVDFVPPSPTPLPREILIARATWSTMERLGQAQRIEETRGGIKPIDLADSDYELLLSLPVYGPERWGYPQYRIALRAAENTISLGPLVAPRISDDRTRHVLAITLFPQRLPKADAYEVSVEGQTRDGWKRLGRVTFQPKN